MNYQKIQTKGLFIGLPCNAKCGFCNAENGLGFSYAFVYLLDNEGNYKTYDILKNELLSLSKGNYDTIIYDTPSFKYTQDLDKIISLGIELGFLNQKYYNSGVLNNEKEYISKLEKIGLSEIFFEQGINYEDLKSIYGFNYQGFIPLFDLIKKLEIYKKDGVGCVVYEGGDFSIYPYIFKALEHGHKLGLKQTFQTNGIKLYDINFVKKLKSFGVNSINFSLHSYIEEKSNKIMGLESGFEKTIKGIMNCVSEGITVSQNVVITPDNYNDIEGLIILALKLQIDLISFIMFIPPDDKINTKDIIFLDKYTEDPIKIGKEVSKGIRLLKELEELVGNKLLNIKFHNIPLCLLDKDLYYSREYIYDTFRKKDINSYTKGTGFYKKESCIDCSLNQNCTGITEYYIKKYGDNFISIL